MAENSSGLLPICCAGAQSKWQVKGTGANQAGAHKYACKAQKHVSQSAFNGARQKQDKDGGCNDDTHYAVNRSHVFFMIFNLLIL